MIDFIKINYTDAAYNLPTDKVDFSINVNNSTGETDGRKTGNYYGMTINKYQSGRITITGSIHKYHNRTEFNGDDFAMLDFNTAVESLKKEIAIRPECCKLENIEIGVNIQLPFCPNNVLKNLLFHRSTEFNRPISGAFYYQSAKNEYIIKAYNKTAQYERKITEIDRNLNECTPAERERLEFQKKTIRARLKPNTMRFEVKFVKMRYLNGIGLKYLSDLQRPEVIARFRELLLNEFREVCFYDFTTDEKKMTEKERVKLKDYRNPNFWADLNRKNRHYHRGRFETLTLKYSDNIKQKIEDILIEKIDQMTKKSLDIFTGNIATISDADFGHIHRSNIGAICPNITTGKTTQSQEGKSRVCEVTGLDISMQKKGSRFLCFSGLKYYMEHDPATYNKLEQNYLTEKMRCRPLEDQIYYIAHNIRNQNTNPRNNRKRFEERNYPKHQLQINFINP